MVGLEEAAEAERGAAARHQRRAAEAEAAQK
eukprot:SAG11_NODE_10578_length_819_cov_4.922222_3_plen_30_part_01